MPRRRYISTNISTDRAVNKLAREGGDFATLLYTWIIPHADDEGKLTADPEELLWLVFPGRHDKTAADVEAALNVMERLELLVRYEGRIWFEPESFYAYQSYIGEKKRRTWHPEPTPPPIDEEPVPPQDTEDQRGTPDVSADERDTAENADERRESPENAVSLTYPSPYLHPQRSSTGLLTDFENETTVGAPDPPPEADIKHLNPEDRKAYDVMRRHGVSQAGALDYLREFGADWCMAKYRDTREEAS